MLLGLYFLYRLIKEERQKRVLASDLQGKPVINNEGLHIGVLRNALVDKTTGSLLGILVEPNHPIETKSQQVTNQKYLLVSSDSIEDIRDSVIVGR